MPPLENAPEALNRLGMDRADNILMLGVVNGPVRECLAKVSITNPLIGAEKANLVGNGFVDERFQSFLFYVLNYARDHVTLAAHRTDNRDLAGSGRTRLSVALAPMPVLGFAADECFVDLDNAAKLGFGFDQGGTDFVSHQPSGFDRSEAHIAAKLASAHAFFAGQDQVSDLEPVAERLVGVFKDGPGQMREAIAVNGALFALPMMTGSERIALAVAAAGANDAIRPTASDQIGDAGRFVANWKHGVELGRCKLMNWLWALVFGHVGSSFVGGYCHG
jgi:hypothetical protein